MPPFHLVDAFADRAFAGNPAGVVRLERGPIDPAWAQAVAAEIQASETAFLHPDDGAWRLRWWTPTAEVDLCGHATLAAAHTLVEDGVVAAGDELAFATRSGTLRAWVAGSMVTLDLPSWPVRAHPEPASLRAALAGVDGRYLGRTAGAAAGAPDAEGQANDVVELADEAAIRAFTPDRDAVLALGSTGLIVTAPATSDGDLVSRYFAPAVGLDEDPVTGSAHSTLGPLWAERTGRTDLVARQLSARGGRLALTVEHDRVRVAGTAVTVVRGELLARPGA